MIAVYETIPKKFQTNNVSPTAEKIVRIDNKGNVEFFIRCGDWGHGNDKNRKYDYYKFSFQVDKKFYDNYQSVDDFVSTIQKEQINNLTVSIIRPNKDLTNVHDTYFNKEIQNINIEITKILDDMKDIGGGENSWTIAMVNFLIKNKLKKEATELFNKEHNQQLLKENKDLKELLKGNKKLEKLVEENKDLKKKLEKNKEFEKKFKEIGERYDEILIDNNNLMQQLNKKDEESEQLFEENKDLKRRIEESEEVRVGLSETIDGLREQLKESQEKSTPLINENQVLKQKLKKTNKDLKDPLYKPKENGFLSIFSCCTCGLDKVAEMKEEENEIK